jgi:ATP-dependent DNA helicase RecG
MTLTNKELEQLVAQGESETLEFKRSTALLPRAGETLCAFLNGQGGTVVIGATDTGAIAGQEVSDKTRREIAAMLDRFEPPALVQVEEVELPGRDQKIIVLSARPNDEARPFTFDGRAY